MVVPSARLTTISANPPTSYTHPNDNDQHNPPPTASSTSRAVCPHCNIPRLILHRINALFLDNSTHEQCYCLEMYQSARSIPSVNDAPADHLHHPAPALCNANHHPPALVSIIGLVKFSSVQFRDHFSRT